MIAMEKREPIADRITITELGEIMSRVSALPDLFLQSYVIDGMFDVIVLCPLLNCAWHICLAEQDLTAEFPP